MICFHAKDIFLHTCLVVTKNIYRNLKIFDATCPLVTKVHLEVHKYSKDGVDVILIGHKGHPEIEGTMGQYDSDIGHIHLVESEEDVAKLNIDNNYPFFFSFSTISDRNTTSGNNPLQKTSNYDKSTKSCFFKSNNGKFNFMI